MGVPIVIGGDNLPSPVGIGLTDLPNIGKASGPPGPPVPASLQCTRSANKAHRAGKQPSTIGREEKMKRSRKNRSLLNLESRQRHANYVHSRRNRGAEG